MLEQRVSCAVHNASGARLLRIVQGENSDTDKTDTRNVM